MRFERPILFSGAMVKALHAGKTQTRRLVDTGKLRVVPRFDVKADPMFEGDTKGGVFDNSMVKGGKPVRACLHQMGAVSAIIDADRKLGLKPREFDFVCPYAQGQTYLIAFNQWLIVPADSWLWVREQHSVVYVEPPVENLISKPGYTKVELQYRVAGIDTDGGRGRGPFTHKTFRAPPDDADKLRRWLGKNRPGIHMHRWASRTDLRVCSVRLERLQDITEEDARAEGVLPLEGLADEQPILGDRHHRTQGTHPCTLAFAVLWDTINGDRARFSDDPWVWAATFTGAA